MSRLLDTAEMLADDLDMPEIKAKVKQLRLEQMSAKQIIMLRKRENATQGTMAATLNVALSTYQKWEQDRTHPSGPALKLLNLVQKNGLSAIS